MWNFQVLCGFGKNEWKFLTSYLINEFLGTIFRQNLLQEMDNP